MAIDVQAQTEHGRRLQARLSAAEWGAAVDIARTRAALVATVLERYAAGGESLRATLERVTSRVPWSTFLNWRRKSLQPVGPEWERQLDGRSPPSRAAPATVVAAACAMRGMDAEISTQQVRALLVKQFGKAGVLSDSAVRQIWSHAGLGKPSGRRPGRRRAEAPDAVPAACVDPSDSSTVVVERYSGGGGLALAFAAEVETGAMMQLASTIQSIADAAPAPSAPTRDERAERDAGGRFTAEYNARWRVDVPAGEADARWGTDSKKASWHDLGRLRVGQTRQQTLAGRLFAMGAAPLVTHRRGFDGLAGPTGEWLGVTGRTAYMPATLDKTLAELGLLDVDEALWDAHAAHWSRLTSRWSTPGPAWLQSIAYIDGTADPHWTQAFAKSGKVSRVGRVMPCLSRVAVNSGAGVPLLVTTHAGTMPLTRALGPLLARLRQATGVEASVDRLTVVDSEAGNAGLLWALHDQHDVFFITVIKGNVLAGATVTETGPWTSYRERDELCESTLTLTSSAVPNGVIHLRAIQMRRHSGRHPKVTVFATNVAAEDLATQEVASVYLARWPKQEQVFRDARNGGGLNRSFGYGGEHVTHLALEPKRAKATAASDAAERNVQAAQASYDRLCSATESLPADTRKEVLELAHKALTDATKRSAQRAQQAKDLHALPTDILQRDTGRDATMTCLKVTMLLLLEYVLKEYFGGLAAEWRTYIEELVALPVTVRSTSSRRLIQIHANSRQPERMKQLDAAIAEINRRQLKTGSQELRFELVDTPWLGPSP